GQGVRPFYSVGSDPLSPIHSHLLQPASFEFDQFIIVNHVTNLNGAAADFAVFDIDLAPNGHVQHHGNPFATMGTYEEVFHSRYCVLTYQRGSCKQSRQQEE